MTTFAKVENGIVTDIISAEQDFIDGGFAGDPSQWVQTSYNTYGNVHYGPDRQPDGGVPFRKNYAIIGGHYDAELDAFYEAQPFPSWTLDMDSFLWEPPIPYPADDKTYGWDEDGQKWFILT
jgi:hypothetical protein